jgi:formyl-CoA transferase/CoA:oxalate CoA-transferase
MVIELTHPDLGTVRALGNPIKLSRSPAAIHRSPPALGEHTDGVLAELAGLEGSGDGGRRRDG